MLAFLLSCGGLAVSSKNLAHKAVTAEKMPDECADPIEVYNVPPQRFPIPAQVSRHHGCQGIEDMLVIVWPLEASKTNVTAVELLMLMYLDHQNKQSPEAVLTASFIKVDSLIHSDMTIQTAFYELIETSPTRETIEE
jgi:hypothetical protein